MQHAATLHPRETENNLQLVCSSEGWGKSPRSNDCDKPQASIWRVGVLSDHGDQNSQGVGFLFFLVLHQAFNDSKPTMLVLAAGGDAGAQIYVLQINSARPDQGAILIN